jgi:2-dehydro-3-deoxyphosphogluconate aldolase/(4S)-4-hydroxy-2-oxoglutarate aldolase
MRRSGRLAEIRDRVVASDPGLVRLRLAGSGAIGVASALGVEYLRALRPVLPNAALVPTGGVSAASAREWLDAGAVAVGVGGSLTRGDTSAVGGRAAELLGAIRPGQLV